MYMNAAFDNVCFKGSVVSQSARFVYLCLCKHADNTHQTCFPSLSRIAEIVGKSISTIKRAVRELCKYGAIERNPRFRKDGGQTSNLYKVATEKNFFSESKTDNESTCACTTIDNEIDQENNQIEESIDNDLENYIQNPENNSEPEFAEINICAVETEQQNIEIDETIHISSMIEYTEDKNIHIEPKSRNNSSKALNVIKKSALKLVKKISTKMSSFKIHIFKNNELGGGHR